ncbi:MAG TPA: methylglyoxal synthase [Bacteroidales bacterium]|jgi:methylglyoxal synthase|nr:methylglyoxal synthase [Bacteroidales bacterium]MCZ2416201.1 methylglyoxal synthase [Burkholderiales bacterium]OQC58347.1 MAG: Methylglyoxal synthase [Bacteroidetes bacterium ADurb.Bin013]MBP8998668.1 methylglyoxal synthase [Bacteroidales bacterium]MBV6456520.1 Methylglyoxal synthase [Bacteroidales bacterium]
MYKKTLALIAHDNKKKGLIEWVEFNRERLSRHKLVCTGTTGRMVEEATGIHVSTLKSGPLGGDQQMGALIAEGKIDMLIFFWDPMQPQPHDVDIKALLRISSLYNIPTACNRSTADFIISSTLFDSSYIPAPESFDDYLNRPL